MDVDYETDDERVDKNLSYFLSEPTEEDLRPTERERLALLGLYHWRKASEEESIPIGRHDCTGN